jgi:hypothetical protein
MLVRLADGNNKSAKCDGKQCDSTGTSKQGESHSNVHDESDKPIPASEKGKPCQEPGTDAEREFSFRTSDGLNFSSQVKRKIDFISSPTLVEKVKLRKNRQPSKVLQSPYADLKQKRVSTKKTNAASVGMLSCFGSSLRRVFMLWYHLIFTFMQMRSLKD